MCASVAHSRSSSCCDECLHPLPCSALAPSELFVNQFPCEALITCKDQLAQVALRVAGAGGGGRACPEWLPVTYNLQYELPQMVKEYYQCKERCAAHTASGPVTQLHIYSFILKAHTHIPCVQL